MTTTTTTTMTMMMMMMMMMMMLLLMMLMKRKTLQIWFLPLIYFPGHFKEIDITALLLMLKPRHVEKFRKCWLTDVGESVLRK